MHMMLFDKQGLKQGLKNLNHLFFLSLILLPALSFSRAKTTSQASLTGVPHQELQSINNAYINLFHETLGLLTAPANEDTLKALQSIDADRKKGEIIHCSWLTQVKDNVTTQVIELRSPSASYTEINTFDGTQKIISLSVTPGSGSRSLQYAEMDHKFQNSLVALIKKMFEDHTTKLASQNPKLQTKRDLTIQTISKWQPTQISNKSIADTLNKWYAETNVQFKGILQGDLFKGKLKYQGGEQGVQKFNQPILKQVKDVPTQAMASFLGFLVSNATAKELVDHMLAGGLFSITTELAIDLASRIEPQR